MLDAGSASAAVVPAQRPTRARHQRARYLARGPRRDGEPQGGSPEPWNPLRSVPRPITHAQARPSHRSGTQHPSREAPPQGAKRPRGRRKGVAWSEYGGTFPRVMGRARQFFERASSENEHKRSSNTTFARLAGRGGVSRGVSVTPRGFVTLGVVGRILNPCMVRGFGELHGSGETRAGDDVSPRGAAPPAPRGPPGGEH